MANNIFDKVLKTLGISNTNSNKTWIHPTGVFTKFADGVKKALTWKVKRQYVNEIKAEMDSFRQARAIAENPFRPDRRALYGLYHNIILDDQIVTQIRVASNTIIRAPFQIVDKTGNVKKEAEELFRRPWFLNYLKHDIYTEMYGHSLIEFNPTMTNGEFTDLALYPRDMVRPEFGDALINQNDQQGVPYRDNKEFPFLLELGDPDDLGILMYCAIPAIRKKYSDTDWSLASEKFGMPFLVVKTQSRQDAELDAKESMAKNFGANGYAILDDTDQIDMLERTGAQGAHLIYFERIKYADEQIAKIINGQTSTSDQKSYTGSANVHERILNDFSFARMTRIEFNINFILIPFLIRNGYNLSGFRFQFKELIEKEILNDDDLNNDANPKPKKPKPDSKSEKKKLGKGAPLRSPKKGEGEAKQKGEALALSMQDSCDCCESPAQKVLPFGENLGGASSFSSPLGRLGGAFNLDDIINRSIKDIYDGKKKSGDLDADLWKATADKLTQGAEQGYGKDFANTSYTDPDKEVLAQLRNNAAVFAAFKNHANMADMFSLLTDSNGNKRSFQDFKTEALKVNATYNVNWLEAEYQTAVATARMAARYNQIVALHGPDVMCRYDTVGDERVRLSHRKLDGTTKPLSDVFWKTFFPPNGWRCRCDVLVVPDEPEVEAQGSPTDTEVPPTFRFNAGENNELFSADHPYFANVTAKQAVNIKKALNKLKFVNFSQKEYYLDPILFRAKDVNTSLKNVIGFHEEKGVYSILHKKHSFSGLADEFSMCKELNELSFCVELTDETIATYDAMIEGKFYQMKRILKESNVGRRMEENLSGAIKKGAKRILISVNAVDGNSFYDAQRKCAKNIGDKLLAYQEIWFINNGKSFKYDTPDKIKAWIAEIKK